MILVTSLPLAAEMAQIGIYINLVFWKSECLNFMLSYVIEL